MPEYLAPGVYVEEVDTGSKPIEGVSTSTAAMVGVAERGPVDVPILITSFGEYRRWFGDFLPAQDFSNNNGRDRHFYLPHAVQGFFENGGKRVYIVRVLDTAGAVNASNTLFDRGDATSANTVLLRATPALSGAAPNPPRLVVLDGSQLALDDWVRIGDGSSAEYRQVAVAPAAEDTVVPLDFAFARSHASGAGVLQFDPTDAGNRVGAGMTIVVGPPAEATPRGARVLTVDGATAEVVALAGGHLLEIGGREYRFIVGAPSQVRAVSGTNSQAQVTLDSPLRFAYPNAAPVQQIAEAPAAGTLNNANIDTAYNAGDPLLFVDTRGGAFDAGAVMTLDADAGVREVRRIGRLGLLTLASAAYDAYPAGSLAEQVGVADDERTIAAQAGDVLTLDSVRGLVPGQPIILEPNAAAREVATIRAVDPVTNQITLANTPAAHPPGAPVTPAPKALTQPASAGASFLSLNDRMGLEPGTVVRIGGADGELVVIAAVPNRAPAGPDAGNVRIEPQLRGAYPNGTLVTIQAEPALTPRAPSATVLEARPGDATLLLSDGSAYVANDIVRLTTSAGNAFYHRVTGVTAPTPDIVTLRAPLEATHAGGSVSVERDPLFRVQALDQGAWGNRLRVSVQDEEPGVVSRTELRQSGPARRIRLGSLAGVEPGTILELQDPATGAPVGGLLKVEAVNRTSGDITIANPGITAAQSAAMAALPAGVFLNVRSREFRLTLRLLRQPDPAVPSRAETVIAEETFRYLSMDPRHSRYVQTVMGDINGPPRLSDRRPEGESWYARVRDLAQDLGEPNRTTALESIRLGPEALVDILPDGRTPPARHPLTGGFDSVASLTDATYLGQDNPTPELRTGLQSLRNIEEVSIVACPGRTGVTIQNALISHCELLRYRFAVLDGQTPPQDTLADVQAQRQQFDSKYAALYYPWLNIPDPFPVSQARVPEFPIPPSGHILGVYARTDVDRGVHKAPANEVVRGILSLNRVLTKEQHDILNPYPVNINVIRDFRLNNRAIRVFGGRVITSDPDWKYVNVRRLMIFIEASIDRGLQWVVFEPNADPLWARVRRSISNFLTTVWRNGALEGIRPEEAFFVKCDRTTMTQTDIDNGRLIVQVGVAPVKPAEFVIIRIGLWTAHAEE